MQEILDGIRSSNLRVEMEATVTLMIHHQFQFLTLGCILNVCFCHKKIWTFHSYRFFRTVSIKKIQNRLVQDSVRIYPSANCISTAVSHVHDLVFS